MKVAAIQGDITKIKVDAIVNAANHTLLGGGGVDGMIHYHAGSELRKECEALGGCNKGEAKLTKGYNLPAKFIIHTVGPVYGHENGLEAEILSSCYKNSLELAKKHNLKTIAFPAISTGCFKYPRDEAARIVIETMYAFIDNNPNVFEEIIFVLFDKINYAVYKIMLEEGIDANLDHVNDFILEK